MAPAAVGSVPELGFGEEFCDEFPFIALVSEPIDLDDVDAGTLDH